MIFGGIQRCSTIDFPGYLSCVLFTRGCDLNCFYCHNRALLSGSGPVLSMQEVFSFLKKRRGLLDGVVVSGGEPALQPDIAQTLRDIRHMGYRIKLDTNGQHPDVTRQLLQEGLLDYVAVDFKAPQQAYGWVCAANGYENALETIALLHDANVAFEVRTTLYPGLHEEALLELLRTLPPQPRYRLNLFQMPELHLPEHALLLKMPALTAADLDRLTPHIKAAQPNSIW